MKKIASLLLFTSVLALASCGSSVKKDGDDPSTDAKVTSVSLNTNQASMFVNETLELSASVLPTNAKNKNITWESSNSEYATVLNGVVSALKEGNVTITARSEENNNLFDSCYITISKRGEDYVSVSEVTLDRTSLTLEEGESETLVATVLPQDATNKNVTWKSNDFTIATVNNGVVTAKNAGTTQIIVTSIDGAKSAECTVKVNSKVVNVTEVKLDKSTATIFVNEGVNLTATVLPQDATNKSVTWRSSDNNVATVENGSVRGKSAGSAIITVTTVDGSFEASCTVTVKNNVPEVINVTGVSLDQNSLELEIDDSVALSATVSPSNATNKNITWTSSNNSVATVSDSLVIAKSVGIAVITVKTEDGNKTATCNVTVSNKSVAVTGVTLNQSSIELEVGKTQTLAATVLPDNATNKTVSWTSSKTTVATVSGGVVSAKAVGSAVITVKTEDGNKTATCNVTVKAATVAVTGVSLNKTSLDLTEGEAANLVATVSPSNATNKNVSWSSDKTTVATVSDGLVTAKGEGTANITVKTEDGNKTATCAVTVSKVSADAWVKVTSTSDLISGDTIVFVSSDGNVAGSLKKGGQSNYLESVSGSTIVNDKITKLASGAQEFDVSISGSKYTFTSSNGTLGATAAKKLTFDDITYNTWTISISNGSATVTNVNATYGAIKYNASNPRFCNYTRSSGATLPIIYRAPRIPIVPTGISIGGNIELAPGDSKTLAVTYTPAKANTELDVEWSSSNTSVATVTDGTVEVKSTAAIGAYSDITATLKRDTSVKSTIRVIVVEVSKAAYTIMMYICGADLESVNGFATADITEILGVSGQPEDVNIIMETGGASSWNSKYGISSSELGRYSVSNKKLNKVSSVKKANMGLTSTLQSFVTWGLETYPAEKVALILWNHGGAMAGVCYDENFSNDSLSDIEVKNAISNSFTAVGRSSSDKLEWIGYDACLMAVQDIAEMNSTYFNYMIASEESEAGEGWDYDTWVDDLYAHKSTDTILKAIVDGFIKDNGGSSSSSNQTLSYMDLSFADEYLEAWEALASQLYNKVTNSNKSSFNSAITGKIKHYADSDYDYYCTFDAKDFINKLVSNSSFSSFRVDSSYTDAVLEQFSHFVVYSVAQKGAGESYGICMFWPNSSSYSDVSNNYKTTMTNFTNWRKLCIDRGYHN